MEPNEYEITDGFVGSLGISYKTATPETLQTAVAMAATRNGKTEADIVAALEGGELVAWRDSPNYYYDHGIGYIRRKRPASPPPAVVRCSCGHIVDAVLVMSTSRGTSCPDCYDKMSD